MREARRIVALVARLAARDQRGLSFIEVLVASLVVGIAGVGIAVMFGTGQAYINAEGDNRVSLFLAQQRIEQIRALGYASLFASPPSSATQVVPYPTTYSSSPAPATYTRRVVVDCVPRDDYAAPSETCVSGSSALKISVTVSVSPADAKSPPVVVSSILAPR